MIATAWHELEKVLHDAIENKQSTVTISVTSLKHLRRVLRSNLRYDGILGFDEDGKVLITPTRAAQEASELCAFDLHEPGTIYETIYKSGEDVIEVHAKHGKHTTIAKYTFAQIEAKRNVKIVC